MSKKTIAMILAGGRVDNYLVFTVKRAKAAVPFGGCYRIIDFAMSNLMHSGIENVAILAQYRPSSLIDHIAGGTPWDMFGHPRGAKILTPYQHPQQYSDWYKGTANAIYQNLEYIYDHKPNDVLVLSGDHVYKMDYTELIKFHNDNDAAMTIAVSEVPISDAVKFGNVIIDENFRVIKFEEKPPQPISSLVSLGIYVFNVDKLIIRLKEIESNKDSHEIAKDLIPHMLKNGDKVFAYKFDGFWRYIGTIYEYWQCHNDLLDDVEGFNLDKWEVRTNPHDRLYTDRPPARFESKAELSNSIVSRGCVINGKVERSVLSPGVIVEDNAAIYNSIIMHDTVVKKGAVLDRVIVDKDVIINENSLIGFGKTENVYNKEFPDKLNCALTIIGKGVEIPPSVQIGRAVAIFPNVVPSDFPSPIINDGETIKHKEI